MRFLRKGGTPVPFFVRVDGGIASLFLPDGKPADLGRLRVDAGTTPPAPSVETTPQTIESARRLSLGEEAIASLPLRGIRNTDDLALLAPGVEPPAETPGEAGPGIAPGLGTAGQFAVNGLRSRDNNFNADGQDNRDDLVGVRRQGFFATTSEPADAMEEFQIFTALYDSRSGLSLGAQVNSLSRHGAARYHGSAYGLFTSDALRGSNQFDQSVHDYPGAFVPVTTDGTLGGPAVSLSLPSGYTGPLAAIAGRAATPNPLLEKNNLLQGQGGLRLSGPIGKHVSGLFAAEGQATDANQRRSFIMPTFAERGWFGTGATGFVRNNTIVSPDGSQSFTFGPSYPASLPGSGIFSLLPFPNNPLGPYGPNTFTESLPAGGMARIWSAKLDFSLPRSTTASVRYNRADDWADIPAEGDGIYSSIRPRTKVDSIAGFLNARVPRFKSWFLEMRVSWGRSSINFDELRDPSLRASSIPNEAYLLNAPLLLNNSSPDAKGASLVAPTAVSAGLFSGLTDTEQVTGPLGQLLIAGFSPAGVDPYHFPQSRTDSTFQSGVTVSHLSENQSTYGGLDVYLLHLNQYTDRNARPQAVFGGMAGCCYSQSDITGNQIPIDGRLFDPLSLAAAGIPMALNQTLFRQSEGSLGLRRAELGFFFHRYQRLGSRLHVNLGARVDVASLPKNQSSRLLTSYNPANLASDVADALMNCGELDPNTTLPQVCAQTAAALNGALPTPLIAALDVRRPYFDVRGGFAWDIRGNGRTVIRGGAGTYHGQFPAIILDESRSTLPNYLPLNFANAPGLNSQGLPVLYNIAGNFLPGTFGPVMQKNTLNSLANTGENIVTFIAADLANANPILMQTGPTKDLQGPWALHAYMGIERQIAPGLLASAAYVGTQGRELLRVTTPTQVPGVQSLTLEHIIFPTLGTNLPSMDGGLASSLQYLETLFQSQSYSTYHSLQMEVRGNLASLQFGVSFTVSTAVDNASDFFDLSGAPAVAANSANRFETGPSNFDTPLRGAGFFVWELPRSSRRLLNRWRLSGILSRQSGQPFTVNSVYDVNGDGNLTDRPVLSPTSTQDGNRLVLAPSGSAAAVLGVVNGVQTGEPIRRNSLRMPAWNSVDIAIVKSLALPHGMLLTPRMEIFNALNSVRFAIPDRWLGSPAFGLSDRSLLAPRSVQFVLRVDF